MTANPPNPPTSRTVARLPKRLSAMHLLVGQTETITLKDAADRATPRNSHGT